MAQVFLEVIIFVIYLFNFFFCLEEGGEVILVLIHVNLIQFIFLQLNLGTCLVMPAGKSSFCLVA